jgi:FAD/FMN-containing dehydrogenase
MVLIGDIVGDDEDAVARATSEVIRMANGKGGEGFIAVSPEARKKFWLDRSRTAAIARHTNAFKINEDVVIPLPRMGEYTDGIERINIELSIKNKLKLTDALEAFFARGNLPLGRATTPTRSQRRTAGRPRAARADAAARNPRALALPAGPPRHAAGRARAADRAWPGPAGLRAAPNAAGRACSTCCRTARSACWKNEIRAELRKIFNGGEFKPILDEAQKIHKQVLRGRVFVALHMHAGDGNVHTNIPVNSTTTTCCRRARAVARIMTLARSLDGVISGEHGIGITKLEFLTDDEIGEFRDYKQRVDPQGRFNKGKLLPARTCAMPTRRRSA